MLNFALIQAHHLKKNGNLRSQGDYLPINLTPLSNQKKIKIVRNYGTGLAEIPLIVDQIKQVVLNLLNNSGEAMAETGGEIRISTSLKNNRVLLTISDTGEGIEPQMLDLIFQPFFTTKPGSQGTGLGLSLSREIVKRHGGAIQVTNNPQGGAVFTVELPLAAGE